MPPTPATTIASSVLASGQADQPFIGAVHTWQEQPSGLRAFALLAQFRLFRLRTGTPLERRVIRLNSGSSGPVVGEKLIHQCRARECAGTTARCTSDFSKLGETKERALTRIRTKEGNAASRDAWAPMRKTKEPIHFVTSAIIRRRFTHGLYPRTSPSGNGCDSRCRNQ